MKLLFTKTPKFVTWLFPKRIWAFSRSEDKIYLTFDDGPIPEVTTWVLDQLKAYNAKATFFCIGENIKKHTNIFERIISEGHAFGNHSFNHLKGTETSTEKYIQNVDAFEKTIQNLKIEKSNLFRPPYGKITKKQAKILQKKGYKIVMWDVLSYDWDKDISEEKCLQNVLQNIQPGSIVVFHDSLKAEKNLRFVLPKVLDNLSNRNLKLAAITQCKT
ncbi:MAG TPA: polysaccharide deacetylase family protein [Flavobacteriaceae bacterium]|nr:polysaccharide deacetylase family protein [Flavobacteriaceae bacterium]HAT63026.1 polysaccharide deacetylase family protein [Flavobacteriaceae bacterium]|tara:strand:+ start:194 stop:844 length:651 start_codon:yes stop_codon:yes gene_type:complete